MSEYDEQSRKIDNPLLVPKQKSDTESISSLNESADEAIDQRQLSHLSLGLIPEYKVSPYRWVILFAFFNLLVAISSVQTSLTPVCQPLAVAFKVQTIVVTMSSIVFSITYIPMTFIAIKMFKEMSLSTVFRIACVIAIIGAWIRVLAEENKSFTWILVGYTVISLSYPILLSAVTLICNRWLGDSERTVITQLCGLAIPIGTIVSFVLSGLIYADPDTLVAETKTLVLVQNIWITSFAALLFIVIKDKPA